MADTTTPNILLTNQTEGGNNNSWGTLADQNFEYIDDKVGDVTSISTSGGNTTLTQTQERANAIVVSGTLVSNVTITFSGRGGSWVIKNNTSGNYSVTCKVSGQSGTEIEEGTRRTVYCNGTDIESASGPTNATQIPSGTLSGYLATTAPTGWVRANGRTIGNGSSGGTERANSDTETLYSLLWSGFSNTVLPIQDSAGTLTSRGASAAADYAANKRMPLPDLRGRAFFGLDDMGNSAASRLGTFVTSATTNGSSGGSEGTTLTTTELPAHTHTGPSHTHSFSATTGTESADHTHSFSATTSSDGAHTHAGLGTATLALVADSGNLVTAFQTTPAQTTGSSGTHTHTVSGTSGVKSATHTHSVSGTTGSEGTGATSSTGSGAAFSNMPPCWLGTWIIKL